MFVSVGSAGNLDADLTGPPPPELPLGAAWGDDLNRADVLEFPSEGGSHARLRHRPAQLFGRGDPARQRRTCGAW